MNSRRPTVQIVPQAVPHGADPLSDASGNPPPRPIRVLNLISKLSRGGGIPRVVREIVRRSDPARVEHHVAQFRPLDPADFDEELLRKATYHSIGIRDASGARRILSLARANVRFARLVNQIRPDVVHVHTGTALGAVAARLSSARKAAWLFDFHEPLDVRHSAATTNAVNGMVRYLGYSGVAHSTTVMRKVDQALGGRTPLYRIPLGVETSTFDLSETEGRTWRVEHGFAPEAPLVVSVGRVAALKGSPELVEIARRILQRRPDVQFAIIGGGSMIPELVERTRELGIERQVRFMGFVDALNPALAAADICLTATRYEGFGIFAVEAAASGLPVVGTRIDGLIDVVAEGVTGYLIDPDDLDGYAEAVLRLLDDRELRERLARDARRHAREHFDIEGTVRAYEDLFVALAHRTDPIA